MDLHVSRAFVAALLALLGIAHTDAAKAANGDTVADRVLGQANFTSGNGSCTGAASFCNPYGVAIDPASGRIYVTDISANRVLSWPSAANFNNGDAADRVIGQPDFATVDCGPPTAISTCQPIGVAVDSAGNLYVADYNNRRVLEFNAPTSTGMAANRVFGQPDFVTGTDNTNGVSASSMALAKGVAVDAANNLYVADGNHRILVYLSPLSNSVADVVLGQPDFTSNLPNNGGVSAVSLQGESGVAVDAAGNVYVADTGNHRVLQFAPPLSNGKSASRVFGQPDFVSATSDNGGVSANSLNFPQAVAVDGTGNVYVSDNHNRVLEYNAPLVSGVTADRVFGQSTFFGIAPNAGGLGASSLNNPQGLALDAAGNLYIVDNNNNRLLGYDRPVVVPAPSQVGASSRKVHGTAGTFDLLL